MEPSISLRGDECRGGGRSDGVVDPDHIRPHRVPWGCCWDHCDVGSRLGNGVPVRVSFLRDDREEVCVGPAWGLGG